MTPKERIWFTTYLQHFDAKRAAVAADYKWPRRVGYQKKQKFAKEIAEYLEEQAMSAEEAAWRMGRAARFDLSPYIEGYGKSAIIDVEKLKADGYGWMIKGMKYNSKGAAVYELWDGQRALEKIYDNMKPQLGDTDNPINIKYITENRPPNDNT